MIKKKVAALLGTTALLAGSLVLGTALPASAVPGCIYYGSSQGGDGVFTKGGSLDPAHPGSRGRARDGCLLAGD